MSWKDYFYFTRKEKTGLLLFFTVIVLVFVYKYCGTHRESDVKPENAMPADSGRRSVKPAANPESAAAQWKDSRNKSDSYRPGISHPLFEFDPNTADSLTFVRLGLRPYIARNILKYRSKGGRFRKTRDFARIYGLSEEDFSALQPYIKIETLRARASQPVAGDSFPRNAVKPKEEAKPAFAKQEKYLPGIKIDINLADTSEFKKIPNIGSAYARRMVKYREMLGGYSKLEQILEVYGVDEDLYAQILPWLSIQAEGVEQIRVNTLSLTRLKAHPYVNFYQAKVIVELRKKKRLSDIDDLYLLEEFSPDDILRLKPYLSFE